MPPGDYAVAARLTQALLSDGPLDVDEPGAFIRYFGALFPITNTDKPNIQVSRESFDYPNTAWASRLIQEDTIPLVVRYRGPAGDNNDTVVRLLASLQDQPRSTRILLRELQPFVVSIRKREAEQYQRENWIQELLPELGIYEWKGRYDLVSASLGSTDWRHEEGRRGHSAASAVLHATPRSANARRSLSIASLVPAPH
jgi:CRISPR-associated endonuclease/helicase Cas3